MFSLINHVTVSRLPKFDFTMIMFIIVAYVVLVHYSVVCLHVLVHVLYNTSYDRTISYSVWIILYWGSTYLFGLIMSSIIILMTISPMIFIRKFSNSIGFCILVFRLHFFMAQFNDHVLCVCTYSIFSSLLVIRTTRVVVYESDINTCCIGWYAHLGMWCPGYYVG